MTMLALLRASLVIWGLACPTANSFMLPLKASASSNELQATRRALLSSAATIVPAALTVESALAAQEEEKVVDYKAEFAAVKEAYKPIRAAVEQKVATEDWEGLKTYVQGLDQTFRKGKMGKLRKSFPKEAKALREEGLSLTNAVTFDLIAINKAGRSQDGARALEVLKIMDDEVAQYCALEKKLP